MRTENPTIRHLPVPPLKLGECPVWDAPGQALWFEDIAAAHLCRLDMATNELARWDMPATIGSFGLCKDGRIIVALRSGVHFFNPADGSFAFICDPEAGNPHTRLNDGKVGPDGRFWVGSMDDRPERAAIASLYRIGTDGACAKMLGGLRVSNGLAWSADGAAMYHSDTRHEWVRMHDYDSAAGNISNQRDLCRLGDSEGRPDGGAMDAEGYYWSAGVSAGCLNRIGPDGKIERKLTLPVSSPTMPCFGGPDMKTLFVTSLSKGAEAGAVLALEVEAPGVPVGRFG